MHAEELTGKVVGVVDGDTIDVLVDKTPVRIRLYGIDCPEKGQDFGTQAKKLASELAFGKTVKVNVLSVDRYDRKVGDVILPDGKNLNHEMVRAGLAWWYREYAPKDDTLRDLESRARAAKKGLWSHPNPIPPWEFRKVRTDRKDGSRPPR